MLDNFMFFYDKYYLDIWIIIIGVLSASSCALLGNFLVLRKLSMMGDAISHSVLPGLAVAFLLTGSRNSMPMLIGAVVTGILTVIIIRTINHYGKVEKSASMGVVFTIFFAVGLILIVKAADTVDLDPGCVLYGSIELTPLDVINLSGFFIPRPFIVLLIVFAINLSFVVIFYKELKITSFDPQLATTLGINANLIYYILMTLLAVTIVASFESVGSILVIAMLIVPGAVSFILTKKLKIMILLSIIIAVLSALFGHLSAVVFPPIVGFSDTNTAGMMSVIAGILLLLALIFTPKNGLLSRLFNRIKLSMEITGEDILGILYRAKELDKNKLDNLIENLLIKSKSTSFLIAKISLLILMIKKMIKIIEDKYTLTESGLKKAGKILRSHRLWETYLFKYITDNPERLHTSAHQFEHVTDAVLLKQLADKMGNPKNDPSGKEIPE